MDYSDTELMNKAHRLIIQAAGDPAIIPPGRSDKEEKTFSSWKSLGSVPHVDVINENIKEGREPLLSLTVEDKREMLAYIVYIRENSSTKPKDNPNYESARDVLDQHSSTLSDKDLDKNLVKQLKKFHASGIAKPLTLDGTKVVVGGGE